MKTRNMKISTIAIVSLVVLALLHCNVWANFSGGYMYQRPPIPLQHCIGCPIPSGYWIGPCPMPYPEKPVTMPIPIPRPTNLMPQPMDNGFPGHRTGQQEYEKSGLLLMAEKERFVNLVISAKEELMKSPSDYQMTKEYVKEIRFTYSSPNPRAFAFTERGDSSGIVYICASRIPWDDSNLNLLIASVIRHEAEHLAGGGENEAYNAQARFLENLGNSELAAIHRNMAEAYRDVPYAAYMLP